MAQRYQIIDVSWLIRRVDPGASTRQTALIARLVDYWMALLAFYAAAFA